MSAGRLASEAAVPEGRLAPVATPEGRPRPYPVMLLQGIVRSRFSLMRMARGLAATGFEVYNLGGPSPRLPLEEQVERFRRDLEQLGRELARGLKDTDGTIRPASARGDGSWPPPADVLTVPTGHTFMAERDAVIRQTAHFLAHCRFARPPRSDA